jgi:hypothetical protein
MNTPMSRNLAESTTGTGHRIVYLAGCFAVGCFAGALASFFPRLMAIVSGNPTKHVLVFSTTYIAVGCIIAVVVGLVILITETDEEKKLKDVFFTALGLPTLLMGTLSSTATSANVADLQRDRQSTVESLVVAAHIGDDPNASIPVENAPPADPGTGKDATPGKTGWELQDLLGAPAYAQGPRSLAQAQGSFNSLGIAAQQSSYAVVYGSAADSKDLAPLLAILHSRGIESKIQPGSHGDFLLVPADGAVKPYSQAVQSAVRAKSAGASQAYVVPLPGQ